MHPGAKGGGAHGAAPPARCLLITQRVIVFNPDSPLAGRGALPTERDYGKVDLLTVPEVDKVLLNRAIRVTAVEN